MQYIVILHTVLWTDVQLNVRQTKVFLHKDKVIDVVYLFQIP